MARYAINEEGAIAMRKLSKDLEELQMDMHEQSNAFRMAVESRENEIGVYAKELLNLLDDNKVLLDRAEVRVALLSADALQMARRIEELLDRGLKGNNSGGGASSRSNQTQSGMRGRVAQPKANKGLGATVDARILSNYVNAPYFEAEWPRIQGEHSQLEDVQKTNPNFSSGLPAWTDNCQRTVVAYEMRRRGYDVEALPKPARDYICTHPFEVWEDPDIITCMDNGEAQICDLMRQWGDGARCVITVKWENAKAGHAFVAEQVGDETRFYDPQTGEMDASYYFQMVEWGRTRVARVDCLKPSELVKECCIGVGTREKFMEVEGT